MRIRFSLLFCCLVFAVVVRAQNAEVVMDYIRTYRSIAVEEMQRTGVPASITLAQGIHETEAGRSELVLKSNNHFGIKCKSNWTGEKVYHDDDAQGECFRSYTDPLSSYRDHSDFLRNGQRYALLFKLDPEDYKGWAHGLRKAGYATNPRYSHILIKLIEAYNLQQYTQIAMGKTPAPSDMALLPLPGTGVDPVKQVLPAAVRVANYPESVFSINETRVVFARGGTSLLALANQHGLTLSRLLEFNDMTPGEGDVLAQDQLVFLQRKRKQGAIDFHQVQVGETMYDIAQAEGVRYESVLELNQLQVGQEPAPGEKVNLKDKCLQRPRLLSEVQVLSQVSPGGTTGQVAALATTRHIVQGKETLYSISKKYGVSPEKLREWNRLPDNQLRMGQELVIYTN